MYAKAKYSKLVMSKYAILDETNQNQASEQREFHWKKKKWEILCQPQECGGVGFKDFGEI